MHDVYSTYSQETTYWYTQSYTVTSYLVCSGTTKSTLGSTSDFSIRSISSCSWSGYYSYCSSVTCTPTATCAWRSASTCRSQNCIYNTCVYPGVWYTTSVYCCTSGASTWRPSTDIVTGDCCGCWLCSITKTIGAGAQTTYICKSSCDTGTTYETVSKCTTTSSVIRTNYSDCNGNVWTKDEVKSWSSYWMDCYNPCRNCLEYGQCCYVVIARCLATRPHDRNAICRALCRSNRTSSARKGSQTRRVT